jgi:SAM-dependent methyltransferase
MSSPSSNLGSLQRDWDELASVDPFWAVLTHSQDKYGGWDREAFFEAGRRELERILARAERIGLPAERNRALDFGCGLGRLTRALADPFANVIGVDVSERFVAGARELNDDLGNCTFEVNASEDLGGLESRSFDLVHSILVLQHLPSDAMIRGYIAEFVRVTAPDGLVVFQIPQRIPRLRRIQPRRRMYRLLRRAGVRPGTLHKRLGLDPMQVRAMDRTKVEAVLRGAGATLLCTEPDLLGGAFASATYYATPSAPAS